MEAYNVYRLAVGESLQEYEQLPEHIQKGWETVEMHMLGKAKTAEEDEELVNFVETKTCEFDNLLEEHKNTMNAIFDKVTQKWTKEAEERRQLRLSRACRWVY